MRIHTPILPNIDPIPVLDEEFDKVIIPSSANSEIIGPVVLHDDLAWDDQLDNGEEMSL